MSAGNMSGATGMMSGLKSAVQNPDPTFELTVHDDEFPTESFTDREANLFEKQFSDLMASYESSLVAQIFDKRSAELGHVAAFAKQELDGKVFGGINAGDNQIGFDILRPGQIRSEPGTGNTQNDWYFTPSSTGWNDWIGDSAGNSYVVGEDQVTAVFAFMDQDVSTEVSGLNVEQFGRNMDMLPHDLNSARLMDNENEIMVQNLPALVAQDNDQIHMRLRHDRTKESQPRLLGVTFGLGAFLNNEDY